LSVSSGSSRRPLLLPAGHKKCAHYASRRPKPAFPLSIFFFPFPPSPSRTPSIFSLPPSHTQPGKRSLPFESGLSATSLPSLRFFPLSLQWGCFVFPPCDWLSPRTNLMLNAGFFDRRDPSSFHPAPLSTNDKLCVICTFLVVKYRLVSDVTLLIHLLLRTVGSE